MVLTPRTRTFQPKPNQEPIDIWNTQLPIDTTWGIYARQSSPGQLIRHTESTEMQTHDLIQWLLERQIKHENIILFDADLGMSGTLRIDQRPALQELVHRIEIGEIKAVLVYQVSRLFRDLTAIQYSVFANICKEHNCILVTADGTIFNFNNPMHMKMFRYLAEMAAEYLPQQIKLLHEAQLRKARKGYYVGLGHIATGYIVDYDKSSSTYRRFICYQPHAKVIVWLFERFYALEGDINALCRELETMPVLFPDFEEQIDKRNPSRMHRKKVSGGYHLTYTGLVLLLTNPVYLGWWIVQGEIVSKDNHEPILDQEHEYLFWYAFNRLSDYTPEGKPNEHKEQRLHRFYHKNTDKLEGLLKKKITSIDGKVFVHMTNSRASHYCVTNAKTIRMKWYEEYKVSTRVVDDAFTKRFFQRLQETHDFDEYRRWIAEETQQQEMLIKNLTKQLQQIDTQQDAILQEIVDIRTGIKEKLRLAAQQSDEDQEILKQRLEAEANPLIEKFRNRFNALEKPKAELTEKLPKSEDTKQLTTARQFLDFQTEVQKLIPLWEKKPFTTRMEFVNLFVQQAVLTAVSPHWIQLDIHWLHPGWEGDTLYIHRQRGAAPLWIDEEREIVKSLYAIASQQELLALLPDKSWRSIRKQANELGLARPLHTSLDIPISLTWEDMQFMQEKGIPFDSRSTKYERLSLQRRCSRHPLRKT